MAKQKVVPGGTIDAVTPEELERLYSLPKPNVVIGMGGSTIEQPVDDMPMRGTRRQLTAYMRGGGADGFVLGAAAVTDLCDLNPARVAGSIINIGANPVYVYLARAADVSRVGGAGGHLSGIFCGYLFPNGSWDFKLTNDVWCGPVSLFSTLGSTLVWGQH